MDNQPLENPIDQTKTYRIIMIGLGLSGKTVILYRLLLDSILSTIPTIGFNVETILCKNLALSIWDIGGGTDKLRNFWSNYIEGIDGIIYVIDSSDINSIPVSQYCLNNFLQKGEIDHIPVLVFCNKQDLPNAASISQIKAGFQLRNESMFKGCSGLSGEGLKEGLEWLGDVLSTREPNSNSQ